MFRMCGDMANFARVGYEAASRRDLFVVEAACPDDVPACGSVVDERDASGSCRGLQHAVKND